MTLSLERLPEPLLGPAHIRFTRAAGVFNPGAAVDQRSGRVVLLVRVFERDSGRSCLGMAVTSEDGLRVQEVWDRPALVPEQPYEQWGVEDPRITYLPEEGRYAVTYTGYSAEGPRVCLLTTDDLLDPARYRRHGPRLAADNKNCVVFPEKIGGRYAVLHRPMPNIAFTQTAALDDPRGWPADGPLLVGPRSGTWRSSRVGAGAPPLSTRLGWLLPIHGATAVEEGNVYSMGWCVLDKEDPRQVLYVSESPALAPEASYEIQHEPIPQVDMANFPTGVRVVFPGGMVERGDDFVVYYGAADVCVGVARVNKEALLTSLKVVIQRASRASLSQTRPAPTSES